RPENSQRLRPHPPPKRRPHPTERSLLQTRRLHRQQGRRARPHHRHAPHLGRQVEQTPRPGRHLHPRVRPHLRPIRRQPLQGQADHLDPRRRPRRRQRRPPRHPHRPGRRPPRRRRQHPPHHLPPPRPGQLRRLLPRPALARLQHVAERPLRPRPRLGPHRQGLRPHPHQTRPRRRTHLRGPP